MAGVGLGRTRACRLRRSHRFGVGIFCRFPGFRLLLFRRRRLLCAGGPARRSFFLRRRRNVLRRRIRGARTAFFQFLVKVEFGFCFRIAGFHRDRRQLLSRIGRNQALEFPRELVNVELYRSRPAPHQNTDAEHPGRNQNDNGISAPGDRATALAGGGSSRRFLFAVMRHGVHRCIDTVSEGPQMVSGPDRCPVRADYIFSGASTPSNASPLRITLRIDSTRHSRPQLSTGSSDNTRCLL